MGILVKDTYMELGSLIREFRFRSEWTQLQLAEKLGYDSAQFVSLFERGISKIPLETLGQLIILLKIPEKKVMTILVTAYEADLAIKINRGKSAGRKLATNS